MFAGIFQFGMLRYAASLGAIVALLAVAFGAFGAHVLKTRLSPEDLDTFRTGTNYQLFHGIALLIAAKSADNRSARGSCILLLIGILIFCGSLYGISLGAPRWLGAVAPVGGISLMAGWLLLARANWPKGQ